MKDRVKLTQAAIITALAIVLSLATVYVPFLGLLVFAIPVPYAIIATITGVKYALISAVASFFIMMFAVDPMYSLSLTIMTVLPGIAVGYMISKETTEEEKNFKPIYLGTVAYMVSMMAFVGLSKLFFKIDLIGQFIDLMKVSLETQLSIMQSAQLNVKDSISLVDMISIMKNMLPAILFFYSIISASITYYLEAFILRRIKKLNVNLPKFTEFYLPGNAVTASLLLYFLIMALDMMKVPLHTDIIMLNIQLVFSIMFLIQGVSVGIHFIRNWRKKSPNKIMIFIVALFLISGSTVLSFVGMLDSVIDFRRVRSYKST